MSELIFTNTRIIDPASGRDHIGSLKVTDGVIADVSETPSPADAVGVGKEVIDCDGLILSPGLVDLRVKTGEPGHEHRETLASASRAAVAGGITTMMVMPDTVPVIDTPALVDFISRAGQTNEVCNNVIPCGALSIGLGGERMSEIGLMKAAGARAFSHGEKPVASANLLRRAMQYAAGMDAPLFLRADEPSLAGGVMNAGGFAARLGLKGMPVQAEWVGLARDLLLAEMTKVRLIVDQVSTGRSFDLIAQSVANGAQVSTTASAHALFFNELDVGDGSHDPDKAYLTYCKVNPPFRSEEDRLALIGKLRDGSLNAVVSAHDPQPPENKRLPFEDASFGAAGLETLLACLTTLVADPFYQLSMLDALKVVTVGPADCLGLKTGRLQEGFSADLALIDPDKPWKCKRENLRSLSKNSPFDGRLLTGRVEKTFVNGQMVFNRAQEVNHA